MLISYHIKAELCTLFDKVHKAFINSANAPRLCTFYRLSTVKPPLFRRLAAAGGRWLPMGRPGIAAARRRGQKGQGHQGFPCPLLTPPNPPSDATPCGRASKKTKESTDLNLYSSFSYAINVYLREPPRITVRGHSVQGVRLVLRKAPLPSMVCPWSTRRHCGPLAFRRATEGSRVLRKMRGSQEGDKKPFGVLSPFCPCRWAPAIPSSVGTDVSAAFGDSSYEITSPVGRHFTC